MATNFARPTPAQLIARVQSDIEGEVDGVSAQVRRRAEHGIARAVAGVAHGLHGHCAWVAEQIIPDQAAERFLLRWADLFGLSRKAATPATGTITVTGSGGTVPAGTEWIRVADGLTFTTDAEAVIEDEVPETVAITAAEGFEGEAGNLDPGTILQIVTSIAGVDSEAPVVSLSGGTELEKIEELRDRLIDRIQRPPLGGAPGDHAAWALEVPGVKSAWEYAGKDGNGNPGAGKVAVTFVLAPDADGPGIPDGAKVAEVQAYLDARSPAEVIVFAPTPIPFDWQVLPEPDTEAVRNAITAEVVDMLVRDVEPGGVIRVSRFEEAVSSATGETSHETLAPTEDFELEFGAIAKKGTGSYTAGP